MTLPYIPMSISLQSLHRCITDTNIIKITVIIDYAVMYGKKGVALAGKWVNTVFIRLAWKLTTFVYFEVPLHRLK